MSTFPYGDIWNALHIIGKDYHPSKYLAFKCLFDCLAILLPDEDHARTTLIQFLNDPKTPKIHPQMTSREAFKYTVDLHNYVNMVKYVRGQKVTMLTDRQIALKYSENKITLDVWGPSFWKGLIHAIAANVRTGLQLNTYKPYIVSIWKLLPCENCQNHLKGLLIKYNIDKYLRDSNSLFEWTWKIHEEVNERLEKPVTQRLSLELAKSMYTINYMSSENINGKLIDF